MSSTHRIAIIGIGAIADLGVAILGHKAEVSTRGFVNSSRIARLALQHIYNGRFESSKRHDTNGISSYFPGREH